MNLSDAFAKVTVTPEQGAAIVAELAKDVHDRDPELHAALQEGVDDILKPADPPASTSTKSSTSGSSTSGTSSSST